VYPGSAVTVTGLGNYLLELDEVGTPEALGEEVSAA
jgi:hypothetical protein